MFQHSGALVERVKAALALLRNDHQGVTALEYGLLAGLIAVAIIGAATGLGTPSAMRSPPLLPIWAL